MAAEYLKILKFHSTRRDVVRNHLKDVSQELGFKLISETNEDTNNLTRIVYSSPISWFSWGEVVALEVSSSDGDNVEVEIRSRCKLITQIIDWGKNRKNVTRLVGLVKTRSQFF